MCRYEDLNEYGRHGDWINTITQRMERHDKIDGTYLLFIRNVVGDFKNCSRDFKKFA